MPYINECYTVTCTMTRVQFDVTETCAPSTLRETKVCPRMPAIPSRGELIYTVSHVWHFLTFSLSFNTERSTFVLDTATTTRGHKYNLKKLRCCSSLRQNFLSFRVVDSVECLATRRRQRSIPAGFQVQTELHMLLFLLLV